MSRQGQWTRRAAMKGGMALLASPALSSAKASERDVVAVSLVYLEPVEALEIPRGTARLSVSGFEQGTAPPEVEGLAFEVLYPSCPNHPLKAWHYARAPVASESAPVELELPARLRGGVDVDLVVHVEGQAPAQRIPLRLKRAGHYAIRLGAGGERLRLTLHC